MFDDLWDTIKEGAEIICSWADDCRLSLESLMKEMEKLATIIDEEKSSKKRSIFKSLYELVLTKSNNRKTKSNNRKLDWYTSGFL